MTKKTIGILGGMGPLATSDLFIKIIEATPARKDQDHIRVVMDSNPEIPDRTAFITGKGEDPRPLLISGAKNLELLGASFIVIPCNTAHYFYNDINDAVGIPVMHIMREVAGELSGKVKKAGLLASTGTILTRLYEEALEQVGIEPVLPDAKSQARVMDAIYAVKAGDLVKGREIALAEGVLLAERGAQTVISGCTEIPLILRQGDLKIPVMDATFILARSAVRMALK